MFSGIRRHLVKRWAQVACIIPLSMSLTVSAENFVDPVKDGRYRSAHNLFVFGSKTDDKYRIPSMAQLNNGDVVFFAERRLDPLATNDYKRQSIVMRTLKKDTGKLTSSRRILLPENAPRAKTDGTGYKHNLMNPVSVYNPGNRGTAPVLQPRCQLPEHAYPAESGCDAQQRVPTMAIPGLSRKICPACLVIAVRHWSSVRDVLSRFLPENRMVGRILLPFHTRDFPGKAGTKIPDTC